MSEQKTFGEIAKEIDTFLEARRRHRKRMNIIHIVQLIFVAVLIVKKFACK